MSKHMCFFHYTKEEAEGAFLVCGECFHVYKTKAELLEAENLHRLDSEEPEVTDVTKIYSCPLCIHDF